MNNLNDIIKQSFVQTKADEIKFTMTIQAIGDSLFVKDNKFKIEFKREKA